jgi:hypothetical protein
VIFLLIFLTLLQPVAVALPQQSTAANRLDTVIEHYATSGNNMLEVLNRVSHDLKVPMGIEWVKGPATNYGINRQWEHASIHEIIQSLINSFPGYECDIGDGIVLVYPRGSTNDKSNLLNLRLSSFEANKEWVALASERLRLMVRPMILQIEPPPPGAGEAGSLGIGMGGERPVTVKLQNVTVREILSRLIVSAGETNWIVAYSDNSPPTPKGFRPTADPFSTSPISEKHQPLWVLFPWESLSFGK